MYDACLAIVGGRVGPAALRGESLAGITHAFGDALLEFEPSGVLLAGFLDADHWARERDLYEELAADPERSVVAVSRARLDAAPSIRTVRLPEGSALADHWFMLALTSVASSTLVTQSNDTGGDDDERPFDVLWTFDPTVTTDVLQVLAEHSEDVPVLHELLDELRRGDPPAPIDHRFGQLYGVRTLERLEASRRHWHDVSVELRAARRELAERSERQLKLERLASVGTLAASIAHELNNPLASITMAANVLGQLEDPDERARMAAIVESEALRAGRIAGDLLAFVADRELELTCTELHHWLGEVAANYRSGGRPVHFTAHSSVELDIDQDRLRQVVSNLVDNALDAIDGGGDVRIELLDAGDEIHITVDDDGVGIPDAILPRLFDPFITSKPRGKGTGLGLAIARAHLQDHGGDMELVHTGQGGTRFLVRLPRTASNVAPPPADVATGPRSRESAITGRVLVVDDEPPIRTLLETLLRRSGWEVVTAANLTEARAAIEQAPVDAALIDVNLGAQDGPAVLAELAHVQSDLRSRAAFVTGAPPESGEVDGRPVLAKPFRFADLPPLLERLIAT